MSKDKQFAIDHLNKDHTLSLYDYVNAYNGHNLDYFQHDTVKLTLEDVSLEELSFSWNEDGIQRFGAVQFQPALTDLGQLRTRVTLMAFESADKLGVACPQIKEYNHWQEPMDVIVDVFVLALTLKAVSGFNLASVYDSAFTRWYDKWTVTAAVAAYAVHILEIVFLVLPKLRAYRVPSPFYYKWVLATFIGGFQGVKRLNRAVKAKKDHRAAFVKKFGSPTPVETPSATSTGSI